MTETELERMVVRLIGDDKLYEKMLADAEAATGKSARVIKKLGKEIEDYGASLMRAGRSLSLAITAPLAALATVSVREFTKFDKAMTETFAKMGKVTPAVRQEMEKLAKELSMSGIVVFDPTELAKGYEELASAGLDASRAMKALPQVAILAQAGAMDLATAVKLVVGSMASFGQMSRDPLEFSKNLSHFSDVIVGVANETTTGVEQVARAMSADAAVAAREYGMTLEELGSILGVYAMQNKDAEEAGNLTGRAIRLLTATFLKNEDVWKSMGIDLVDKATGKWVKFADAIGMLEGAFKGMTGPQKVATLMAMGFETLSLKSILPLVGQSNELERQEKLYGKVGTAAEMAAIQVQSFDAFVKKVINTLKVAAIELGEDLRPTLEYVGRAIVALVEKWRALDSGTKQVIVIVGAFLAAIGPLLIYFGMITWSVGRMITIFSNLRGVFGGLGSVLRMLVDWYLNLRNAILALPLTRTRADVAATSLIFQGMGTQAVATATQVTNSFVRIGAGSGVMATRASTATGVFTGSMGAIGTSSTAMSVRVASSCAIATASLAALEAQMIRLSVTQKRLGTTAGVSIPGAGSGAPRRIGGPSIVGQVDEVIDADFTPVSRGAEKATKSIGMLSRVSGFAKGALRAVGTMAASLGPELAIIVGILVYSAVRPFGDWLFGVTEFNKQLEITKKLAQEVNEKMGQRQQLSDAKMMQIEDPVARRKAVEDAIAIAAKDVDGYTASIKGAKAQVEALNTTWNYWSSNRVLEGAQQELSEVEERSKAAKDRLHNLKLTLVGMGEGEAAAPMDPLAQAGVDAAILQGDIDKLNASLQEQADTMGMTANEIEIYKLQLAGATEEQLQAATSMAAWIEQSQEIENLHNAIKELNYDLGDQIATFGMTGAALEIYKLKLRGATEEELALANSRAKELESLKAGQALLDKATSLTEKYADPQQKLIETQAELGQMWMKGLISVETYTKALADAEKQAHKDYTTTFGVSGVDAVASGSMEALARIQEYQSRTQAGNMKIASTQTWQNPQNDPNATSAGIIAQHPFENTMESEKDFVAIVSLLGQLVEYAGQAAGQPTINLAGAGIND